MEWFAILVLVKDTVMSGIIIIAAACIYITTALVLLMSF